MNIRNVATNQIEVIEMKTENRNGGGSGQGISVEKAVDRLIEELRADKGFYYTWQSNIAMSILDVWHADRNGAELDNHKVVNDGAKRFLDLLINAASPLRDAEGKKITPVPHITGLADPRADEKKIASLESQLAAAPDFDAIEKRIFDRDGWTGVYKWLKSSLADALKLADEAEYLAELAAAREEGSRWIPVKERLPETDKRVLVSTTAGLVGEMWFFVRNGWHALKDDQKVVAWQDLPAKYEGAKNVD